MNKFKKLLIRNVKAIGLILFLFWLNNVFAQVNIDFNTCLPNSTACNIFSPAITCNQISISTAYGAPKMKSYTFTENGQQLTTKVVELRGNLSAPLSRLDAGFTIPFVFKPSTGYLIYVLASGLTENGVNTKIGSFEVYIGTQQLQQNDGCNLAMYPNPGYLAPVATNKTPQGYGREGFSFSYQIPSANYNNVLIRSKSTSNEIDDYNSVLIHRISITEIGGTGDWDNQCFDRYITIRAPIVYDFSNKPTTGGYEASPPVGAYYAVTSDQSVHAMNGKYVYVSNKDIFLKPGFKATVNSGGIFQALIAKCGSLKPLGTSATVLDEAFSQNYGFIFPNPSKGLIQIPQKWFAERDLTISVTSIEGKRILTKKGRLKSRTVDLSGLNSGVYFITLSTNKESTTEKIIIQK